MLMKNKLFLESENPEDLEMLEAFLRAADLSHLLSEVTLVPVTDYGSEGRMPMLGSCPEYPETDISCVGSSGDNMCGCYMGSANEFVIMCNGGKK